VLKQRGVARPREYLAVYRAPTDFGVDLATVLVGRDPLSDADLEVRSRRAEQFGFSPLLTPTTSCRRRHIAAHRQPALKGRAPRRGALSVGYDRHRAH